MHHLCLCGVRSYRFQYYSPIYTQRQQKVFFLNTIQYRLSLPSSPQPFLTPLQSHSHTCCSLTFGFMSHTTAMKPVPQPLSLLLVCKDPQQSSCSDLNHATPCLGTVISADPLDIKQIHVIVFLFPLNKKKVAYLLVLSRAELGCRWNSNHPQPYRTPPIASSAFKVVDVRVYFYIIAPSCLELTLA